MKNDKVNDKRALFASIFASGLDDLNVMFLSFTLGSIIAHLGLTGVEGGWIATITNFGMLLGGLVFGVLADRYNKFNVLKLTVFIFSVATGLIFFTNNLTYLYIMRFIAGIGVGGEYGVAISIMAGIVPAEKMGRISSLNGVVGQLGSISSAVLASIIAPMFGWRGLFLFGLLPVLLVVWMHFAIDENQITETVLVTDDNSDVVEEDVPNTLVYDDVSFYEAVNKYAKDNKSVNLNSILMYKPVSKNNRIRLKGLGVEQLKKLICACSPLCKEAARKFIKQKGFEDYSSFLSACPSEFEIKNLTIRCMNAVDKYVETNIANNPKQA